MRRQAAALFLIAAAATATGQASQQPPRSQAPTLRASTDYVYTQVDARDGSGRFVPGLTIKDFEVYEDGVRQTVTNFAAMVGGRAMTEVAPAPAAREGLIMPRALPAPPEGRIFIIFIDDLHIQFRDTARLKTALRQIRDTVLHENDLVGIVSSGYSSIAFDLSPDANHARLNVAIEKVSGAAKDAREIISGAQTLEGPVGVRHNAFVAFRLAYDILAQAEKVTNRRKAFIYVSSGYHFNPYTDSRYKALQDLYGMPAQPVQQGRPPSGSDPISSMANGMGEIPRNPFEMNGLQFSSAELMAALGELVRRARAAAVEFWPLDPRGLVAGPDMADGVSAAEAADFYTTTRSSLDVMALSTGGECICGINDFTAGLKKLDNALSDYYVIGYESTNPDPRKVVRRIQIRSTNPGVKTLRYKDRYTIRR